MTWVVYGKCFREVDCRKQDGSFTYVVRQEMPDGMRSAKGLDEQQANKLAEEWNEEWRLHLMEYVWAN